MALTASLLDTCTAWAQPGELIERTLAIVDGQVITLSDVRTASALHLIEADPDVSLEAAVSRLVDRLLMLREVQRYVPASPDPLGVARGVAVVRRRFATPEELAATLAAGGFTESRLETWVRDDLRIAAYLDQRFASVGVPSDDEVAAYYLARRAEFDARGLSATDAAAIIRDRLFAERRGQLIDDWVEDLRGRATIVELWRPSPPGPRQ